MANNRMYLVHRPTGRAVYLAKRLGQGWYFSPENGASLRDRLAVFFEATQEPIEAQDDFMIALEDESDAPMCGSIKTFNVEQGMPVEFYDPDASSG